MRSAIERLTAWWRDPWHRALTLVVIGSFALNATGLLWGLPGYGWAGDELTPAAVVPAVAQAFSNGWWSKWPPLHYYVLALAYSPFLVLSHFREINLFTPSWYVALLVVSRIVSLAAAAGTLVAVFACGACAYSKRAGLFAAAALALVAPFVYYSKTANIDGPWLFWCALSLACYLRMLTTLNRRDVLAFSVSATLAICAKDQTYGLYLAAPLVIVYELWRRNRREGVAHPLRRAVLNGDLRDAALVAALLFVVLHNLPFNLEGFVRHVQYITGGGSQDYRMFAGDLRGRLQLLALTASLDQLSWGWPLFAVSLAGFALACARAETRRPTLWLTALAVSYYVGFVDVILYNYDRFLLPIIAMQALFAGVAVDRLMEVRWGTLAVAGAFACSVLYASTVDNLMLRDSRYAVEDWLRLHASPRDTVGTMFPIVNLPRLDALHPVDVSSREDLQREAPSFYVLNADYARAVDPQSPAGQLISGLQRGSLGYALELRYRSPGPWPWLPGQHRDLVGPRLETTVSSMLRYINPTMEVYQRVRGTR